MINRGEVWLVNLDPTIGQEIKIRQHRQAALEDHRSRHGLEAAVRRLSVDDLP